MAQFVKKEYRSSFLLVSMLFFLWGFAHAILDVLNKHFQDIMGLTLSDSAWVQVMFYLGYFIMAIPAGIHITRHGYRSGVILGLLLFGIGSLLFVPGERLMSFPFFLFSLFVIACGLVFLETAANPYMTELGDRSLAASRLNLAQSFNGLGCICGPLLGGLLIFSDSGYGVSVPYGILGVMVLLLSLLFRKVSLPEIKAEADPESQDGVFPANRGLGSFPLFWFGLAALFFYEVSEISINSFFINYATDGGLMDKQTASVVLSVAGLGLFMMGRFLGSYLMRLVSSRRLLLVCAIGTVCCMTVVILGLGLASLVALILCYAFEAIMFPTIFALSISGLGPYTKRASSYLMMTPIGGAIGPLLMGFTADGIGMRAAFIVPLVGFLVVLAYSWRVNTVISGQAPMRNGIPT